MPKWLHKKLLRSGHKQNLKGDRLDAYIYGTMNKIKKAYESKGESIPSKEPKKKHHSKVAKPGN